MRIEKIKLHPLLGPILQETFFRKNKGHTYPELKSYFESEAKKLGLDVKFPSKSTFLKAYKNYLKSLGYMECEVCGRIVRVLYEEYTDDGYLVKLCEGCYQELLRYKGSGQYLREILKEGIVRR